MPTSAARAETVPPGPDPADGTGTTTGATAGPDGPGHPGGPGGPGNPGGPPTAAPTPLPPRRPRKLRALLIGCVIAAGLGVFLFVGLGTSPGSTSGSGSSGPVVAVGSQAPGFSIPSLTGGDPVRLDTLGVDAHRPVVLNFFASWCGPCQSETPLLARTASAAGAQGSPVRFVGVDVNDPPAAAQAFVQKSGITYPVGVDQNFDVTSGKYGLDGLPQTFFINAEGRVVAHIRGAVNQKELDAWLHRLGGSAG